MRWNACARCSRDAADGSLRHWDWTTFRPMLGFKRFDSAAVTISGIELVQKIQKHQFKISTLGGRSATMPELWNAVLAA
jgi:hypothetical protein